MFQKHVTVDKLPPIFQVPGDASERLSDRQCTELLRGLNRLQGRKERAPSIQTASAQKSFLVPIMPASMRANACIEEVEGELAVTETLAYNRRQRGTALAFDDPARVSNGIAGAAETFQHLVDEIEVVLHGGEHATTTMRPGDEIEVNMLRGLRHYKIPLPSRPTEVVVMVTKRGGRNPCLWASTSNEKPCENHFELKGHQGKVVYKHVLPPPTCEEDIGVDRRRVVPKCRDLFLTLDAQMGDVQALVGVTFSPINVMLNRHELHAQMAKIKRTWATRVYELQHEPMARADFENHVEDLRKNAVSKALKQASGQNFVNGNRADACRDNAPVRNQLKMHKRALQNFARHDAASIRRLGLSGMSTPGSDVGWAQESNRHLQGCDPVVVAGKRATEIRDQGLALPLIQTGATRAFLTE